MNVAWTSAACAQIQGIHDYIAADSVGYAKRMVDRLTRRGEQLSRFPTSGEIVPEYNSPEIRELIEGNYRIIYRVRTARIDIVAVIHGSKQLPTTPPA